MHDFVWNTPYIQSNLHLGAMFERDGRLYWSYQHAMRKDLEHLAQTRYNKDVLFHRHWARNYVQVLRDTLKHYFLFRQEMYCPILIVPEYPTITLLNGNTLIL